MQKFAVKLDAAKLEAMRQARAAHEKKMAEMARMTDAQLERIRRDFEEKNPHVVKMMQQAADQLTKMQDGPFGNMFGEAEKSRRFLDGLVPGDRERDMVAEMSRLVRSINTPLPPRLVQDVRPIPLHQANPAEHFRLKLSDEIADFELTLDSTQEVGIRISDGTFWLDEIVTQPPQHVVFMALTEAGERVRIFKHHTQANVLLIALRKLHPEQEARRIGFRFGEQVD